MSARQSLQMLLKARQALSEAQTKTPIDTQAKLPDELKPYADKLNPVMQMVSRTMFRPRLRGHQLDLPKGVPLKASADY